jgi:hypothetical protein
MFIVTFPVVKTTDYITFSLREIYQYLAMLNPASAVAFLTAVALAKEVAKGMSWCGKRNFKCV